SVDESLQSIGDIRIRIALWLPALCHSRTSAPSLCRSSNSNLLVVGKTSQVRIVRVYPVQLFPGKVAYVTLEIFHRSGFERPVLTPEVLLPSHAALVQRRHLSGVLRVLPVPARIEDRVVLQIIVPGTLNSAQGAMHSRVCLFEHMPVEIVLESNAESLRNVVVRLGTLVNSDCARLEDLKVPIRDATETTIRDSL